jgi:TatD DNase family protein
MFDTHCHLNFSRFKKNVDEVVDTAINTGVKGMVIPGTDIQSSRKAIELAQKYAQNGLDIWAAVGIHPHHVYEHKEDSDELAELEKLLNEDRVVAVGEIGLDRHQYEQTKYEAYHVDERFIEAQKKLFQAQFELAIKHKKSLIMHNREAKDELLPLVRELWDPSLKGRAVLHCCEPDLELLAFAKELGLYLGVDGDLTYWAEKQEFIKQVPLEMLVIETDAPFLLPEPLKSQKLYPNVPANVVLVAEKVAELKGETLERVAEATTANARALFGL